MLLQKSLRIYDRLVDLFFFIAGVLVVVLSGVIVWSVISRYVFGQGVGWAVEVSEYLLFVIACLAAPKVLRLDGHVRFDLVTGSLSPRPAEVFYKLSGIVGSLTCFALASFCALLTYELWEQGVRVVRTLGIPKWYFFVLLTISFLIFTVEFVRKTIEGPPKDIEVPMSQ